MAICKSFREALFRTRTGDPLLTIEDSPSDASGRSAPNPPLIRTFEPPPKAPVTPARLQGLSADGLEMDSERKP
jgi:hypothetical protein